MQTEKEILEYVKSEHRIGFNLGPCPPSGYIHFSTATPQARFLFRRGVLKTNTGIKNGKPILEGDALRKYQEAIEYWYEKIVPVWEAFYQKRRWRNWLIRFAVMFLSGYAIYFLIREADTNRIPHVNYVTYSIFSALIFTCVAAISLRRIDRYYNG